MRGNPSQSNVTSVRDDEFATLFEKSLLGEQKLISDGEVVTGKVIDIIRGMVIVDFGYKCEGQVSLSEFMRHGSEPGVQVGDQVEVYVESVDNEEGLSILSKEKADALKIWDRLQEVVDKDTTIDGVVIGKVKGGLSVDIGVKAFLPASPIDLRLPGNLDRLLGKRFKFKILKLNKQKSNIIVSRRAVLEKDRDYARQEILQNVQEGQTVSGSIKNITDYGVFVDLGGVDGLLHITDMTWGRIGHPSELFAVGSDITVKVLRIDSDSGKISLGFKQLTKDPWEGVSTRYTVGARVKGKVISLADYGAFVGLEEGVEGLVHISEMSWTKKIKHPSKVVSVGDAIDAAILDIDVATRRISLGMKQILENPWDTVAQKYPIGSTFEGTVKNVTDFGVFVGLSDDIDGLVHVSDIAWVRPGRPLVEIYGKGSKINVTVLNIDRENERFSLGIKQLTENIWPNVKKEYGIGSRHKSKVLWAGPAGIAVSLQEGVEALIHKTDLPEDWQAALNEKVKVGDDLEVVVHLLDEREHRLTLGLFLEDGEARGKK